MPSDLLHNLEKGFPTIRSPRENAVLLTVGEKAKNKNGENQVLVKGDNRGSNRDPLRREREVSGKGDEGSEGACHWTSVRGRKKKLF